MSSFSNDDMFVSVMPRILDPSMKFTKESLINSMRPSKVNKTTQELPKEQEQITTKTNSIEKKRRK